MFKYILDHSYLDGLCKTLNEQGVGFQKVSPDCYNYLGLHSRPALHSIFGRYVPIKTLVSVRTDYSNEIIVPKKVGFYVDCTSEYPEQHWFNDMVLLAAKKFVDQYFDCGEHLPKVISRTAPLPLGACYIDEVFYVYITIVIDHNLKKEDFFKLKDCDFVRIDDLVPNSTLESSLIESLSIIQSEEAK